MLAIKPGQYESLVGEMTGGEGSSDCLDRWKLIPGLVILCLIRNEISYRRIIEGARVTGLADILAFQPLRTS